MSFPSARGCEPWPCQPDPVDPDGDGVQIQITHRHYVATGEMPVWASDQHIASTVQELITRCRKGRAGT